MGIAQNLKRKENVIVARGEGRTSAQMGLAKTNVRYLGSRLTWNMAFAPEKDSRMDAAWNAWHMVGHFRKATVNFKFKCNVFKATVQGALLSGLCAFAGQNGSFTES